MDVWNLAMFLDDIIPSMEVISGRIFLDRKKLGREALLEQINNYNDLLEAQKWINMVPLDDFLSEIIDEWDVSIIDVEPIREIYERSWRTIAQACGARLEDVAVRVLRDLEVGDLIFQLEQKCELNP